MIGKAFFSIKNFELRIKRALEPSFRACALIIPNSKFLIKLRFATAYQTNIVPKSHIQCSF